MEQRKFKRKMISAIALACGLSSFAQAEDAEQTSKPTINVGYNALENGVSTKGEYKARLTTNVSAEAGPFRLGYHGLNDIANLDANTFFGRNTGIVGIGPIDVVAVVKLNKDGVSDIKYGVRETKLPTLIGGYGFVDVTFDKDAANVHAFLGKSFGDASLELLQSMEFPFGGRARHYTEIQGNYGLGKVGLDKIALFGRVEGYDSFRSARGIGGISIQFP